MSIGARMAYARALVEAEAFKGLFEGCFERWEFAGSIRREKAEVGDIDHVVITAWGTGNGEQGIFGAAAPPAPVHLLWARCEELVSMGTIERGSDAGGRPCWGLKKRIVLFHGVKHELHTADQDSWIPTLVIRTGPAELSQRLVTEVRRLGRYVQEEGCLRYAGGASKGAPRRVASEREYFELCGYRYVEPRAR